MAREFAVGEVFDNQYRILRRHQGAMGVVYIARDRITDRIFAIKSPLPERGGDPLLRERFLRESQAWVNLGHHPNIVQAYLCREIEGVPYLFLEFVDGCEVREFLRARQPLHLPQAVAWAGQVAAGMAFVHAATVGRSGRGVLHRDLKPSNLLVDRTGRVRVTDFGLSKVASNPRLTEYGFMGTPLYASPEQVRGMELDPRGDLYSFGAVLYELLTGAPPFEAEGVHAIFELIMTAQHVPVADARPETPPELARLVDRLLAKDRDQRPEGFEAVSQVLERVRSELGEPPVPDSYWRCPDCRFVLPSGLEECPLDRDQLALLSVVPAARVGLAATTPVAPAFGSSFEPTVTLRAAVPADAVEGACPEVRSLRIWPRRPRVGETVTVEIAIGNPAPAAGSDAELVYALPNGDDFLLAGDGNRWQGELPASRPADAASIAYRFVARREGSYPPARLVLTWRGADGTRRSMLVGTVPPLKVSRQAMAAPVGRDGACRRAVDLLEAAARGQSSLLLVRGGPGAGKSFFLDWLTRAAEERGFTVASGGGAMRNAEPLKPFLDVVRSYLDLGEAVLTDEELSELVARRFKNVEGDAAATGSFLARAVLGDGLIAMPSSLDGSPRDFLEQVRPHRWSRAFMRMAATSPLLVALDDLHAADPLTLELLRYLAERCHESGARIAFCAALDPPREAGAQGDLRPMLEALAEASGRGAPFVKEIELGNFGEAEVRAALDAFFPGGDLAERFPWIPESILRATGGNPFFVVETLHDLKRGPAGNERYAVKKCDTSWELGEGVTPQWLRHHVPSGVSSLLRVRLGRIPGATTSVLEAAAVAGVEFDVSVLRRLTANVDEAAFEDALDRLEAEDLIHPIDRDLTRYRFTHGLYQAAIEDGLVERSRRKVRRLHREAADALRELAGPALDGDRILEIAEHRIAGGDTDRGFASLLDGIEALHRQERYYQCFEPLARAQELARGMPGPQPRLAWLETVTYGETGQVERALASCRAYIAAADGCAPSGDLSEAFVKAGELCFRLGRSDDAERHFERARELAESAGRPALLSRVHNGLGLLAKNRLEFGRAREHLAEALRLERAGGNGPGACIALINLGNVYRLAGDEAACASTLEEAAALAREIGASQLQAGALLSLGNLRLVEERFAEAEASYRDALRLYRSIGDRLSESTVLGNVALACRGQQRHDEAASHWREAIRVARVIGHLPGELRARFEFAWHLTETGVAVEAQQVLDEARRLARSFKDPGGEARRLRRRAGQANGRNPAEARFFIAEAEALAAGCAT